MRKMVFLVVIWAALAGTGGAQAGLDLPATLRLTLDEAVRMALEQNVDLAADRLDPQISDTRVAAAAGAFRPTVASSVQQNNQLTPPQSFLIPTPTHTDAVTTTAALSQRLPRFGTSYSLAWSTIRTGSNSVLNSYNPLLQSGLAVSLSQPLVRDFSLDSARQQLATSRVNREIAGTRLTESLVHTSAGVKVAYWNLVSAIATVEARKSALALAEELVRVSRGKVDVGQSPALDLVSAQAEAATNQEQLIIAETAVKQAEDRLRLLIFDPTDRRVWNVAIEPVDSPPVAAGAPDVEVAISAGLGGRADLLRARKDIENAKTGVTLAGNQRLPDVRLNVSYQASGLGGTEVLRAGGFPGTVVGQGAVTSFGSVLGQLFRHDYPTWTVGVNVSYPIGTSNEDANYARARLEQAQVEQRLKSAEGRAIQQIRDAAWKIQMNAQRIATTRTARDLAEQRLDAERKRMEVGMSTSFLVIQAQRDLAQARTNEVAAVLAYELSLVDFEALQQAGPQGTADGASPAPSAPASAVPASSAGLTGATPAAATGGVRLGGFGQ